MHLTPEQRYVSIKENQRKKRIRNQLTQNDLFFSSFDAQKQKEVSKIQHQEKPRQEQLQAVDQQFFDQSGQVNQGSKKESQKIKFTECKNPIEKPKNHDPNEPLINFKDQRQLVNEAIRIVQEIDAGNKKIKGKLLNRKRLKLTEQKLNQLIVTFKLYTKSIENQTTSRKASKLSLVNIAKQLALNPKTINILYQDFLYDNEMTNRRIRLAMAKQKRGRDGFTLQRMQAIKKILQNNPFLTQMEIVNHMNQDDSLKRYGREMTSRQVGRLLSLMNYSKKKIVKIPKTRNSPANIEIRFRYCKQYLQWVRQGKKVYFLDESAFNVFTMRNLAWSARGQPVQQNVAFPQGKNLSLCAIISEEGVVHWSIKSGNYRRQHYIGFLEGFINKLVQQNIDEKVYLVMDNCRIHDDDASELLAQRSNILEIKKLPPYSPSLNPIENWFHVLKSKVRRKNYSNERELQKELMEIIETQFTSFDFSNFYRHANTHAERGLQRRKF